MNRRDALLRAAGALAAGMPPARSPAQASATRGTRLIVSSAPGTPPDLVGRLVAERLQLATSEPVIVENKPGAIGTIGLREVASAPPDGRVIGMFSTPFLVAPSLLASMPFDIERDLAPVAIVARSHALLVVPAASPARSVQDLVAQAKAKPGGLVYASGGNGTPSHMASALFVRAAHIEAVHVPFQGASSTAAVVGGQVDMYIGPVATLAALVASGRLRVLATAAPQRLAAFPGVPTLVELGYAGVELTDWLGLVAPQATPLPTLQRLAGVISDALRDEAMRQRLDSLGLAPTEMDRPAYLAFFRAEYRRWNRLVREAGIKPG